MGDIEVKIRDADETRSFHLCTWNVADLDKLLPTIGRWGLYSFPAGQEFHTTDLTGQMVVDYELGEAYFEIILNDEDD